MPYHTAVPFRESMEDMVRSIVTDALHTFLDQSSCMNLNAATAQYLCGSLTNSDARREMGYLPHVDVGIGLAIRCEKRLLEDPNGNPRLASALIRQVAGKTCDVDAMLAFRVMRDLDVSSCRLSFKTTLREVSDRELDEIGSDAPTNIPSLLELIRRFSYTASSDDTFYLQKCLGAECRRFIDRRRIPISYEPSKSVLT